jgi:O-antigen/teichoic acid export membrane protein
LDEPTEPKADPPAPEPGGLARRFVVGGLYVSLGSWATNAANFVIGLLLARLLGPEIFGLYALVAAIDQLIGMIGAFSIQLALVQHPRESARLYDTAFGLSLLLGVAGLLAAFALAPVVGHFRSPQAAWLLIALGVGRLITLASQAPLARLERNLQFRRVAAVGVLSANLPNLAALGLALLGAGAWSLVAKDVLHAATMLLLGFWFSDYRFRGHVDRQAASELMAFGRPMFLSRALEIALDRIDRLLVGSWLGNVPLGLYNQARVLAETTAVATRTLSPLAFNLYARLQGEPQRLARASGVLNYLLVRSMLAVTATLLVFPAETIRLLLGEEWLPAAPILRWLAPYAALLPLFEGLKVLLLGRGAVRLTTLVRFAQLALFVPGIALASAAGRVEWVAAALLASTAVGVELERRFNRDFLEAGLRDLLAAPAALVGAVWLLFAWAPFDLGTALPFWVLPALPALLYAVLLGALEQRRLRAHFAYLQGVLQRS